MKTFIFVASLILPLFALGQDACSKACVINSECGVGGLCNQGTCQYQKTFCFNERWASNERGETSNCDAYRCDQDRGLCLRSAKTTTDCLTGYVFDGKSSCLASIDCQSSDPHCQDLMDRWKKAREEYEASTPEPSLPPLSCQPCEASENCGTGKMCWQKRCVASSNYCEVDSEGTHHQVGFLRSLDCGVYVCDKVSGACLNSCLKTADCRSGRKCIEGLCQ